MPLSNRLRLHYPATPFEVVLGDGKKVVVSLQRAGLIDLPGRAMTIEEATRLFSLVNSPPANHDVLPAQALEAAREIDPLLVHVDRCPNKDFADHRRISAAFAAIEALVPKRIANEEIGDALEQIAKFSAAGRPRWHIYAKALSAAFWILTHAVGDIRSLLQGKAK